MAITAGASSGTFNANGVSGTTTLTIAPAAGNTLIVAVRIFNSSGATGATVTDNNGNTYAKDQETDNNGTNTAIYTFRATNITGTGTFTITLHLPAGSSNFADWGAQEFISVAASPLDAHDSGTSTNTSTQASGTTGTLAQADEVAIFVYGASDNAAANDTITEPSGWTTIFTYGRGDLGVEGCADYLIVSATTALNPSGSTSGATGPEAAQVQTYKGSAVAAAPVGKIVNLNQAVQGAATH